MIKISFEEIKDLMIKIKRDRVTAGQDAGKIYVDVPKEMVPEFLKVFPDARREND